MANKNLFNSIKLNKPKRNYFDLTHDVKLSLNMGDLVPILCMEAVPGDSFELSCESLVRFQPMIAPVMHRMDVTMHYFFVPNRILWDGWEDYIANADSIRTHPTVTVDLNAARFGKGSLTDYLGVPLPTNGYALNALPYAAYQRIYNDYYRDQNLIPDFYLHEKLVDGFNDPDDLINLRKRAWQHDYFTSALPFSQKGGTVDIPIQNFGDVPVYRSASNGSSTVLDDVSPSNNALIIDHQISPEFDPNNPHVGIREDGLYADTSELNANPTTINDLRRAFRLQEWLEKNARAGTRYVESILAHFGVKSSDARLQRPEYITGTKSPVIISEVLNTTGENAGLPQGNMAGHGVSVTTGKYGKYYCEEHGFIIGIMSVLPLPSYQQGIPRHFLKKDKFSYYWPEFAHIGEQEVYKEEIYANTADFGGTFGYVPRYAEYKYMPSRVCGDLRDNLNFWHLGRIFENEPQLNMEFIEANPTKRIFAVEDPNEHALICQVLNKIKAMRPMPKFGTPTF